MPFRRSRKPLSRAARLTKEWISGWTFNVAPEVPGTIVLAPGTIFTDWILTPAAALTDFDEPTVMRMLFQFAVGRNQFAAASASMTHCGIIVTRADSGGFVPSFDPNQEGYYDWLWTHSHVAVSPPGSLPPALTETARRESLWDIKTRRRVLAGQGIGFIAYHPSENTNSVNIWWQGRTLLAH